MARLTAFPSAGLRGGAAVPGDKSISHRALILAAMTEGESRITGLAESEDVMRTATAVRSLGAEVEQEGGVWHVRGGAWRSLAAPIDCGNSGTAARLLMGAVAGRPVSAVFTGDESLRRRPMRRVTEPLRRMGARIEGDALPITVHGGGIGGIHHESPIPSAQVKSAILLAGLGTRGPVAVTEPRETRDHTERLLRVFGCDVAVDGPRTRLGARRSLHPAAIEVPGDASSAAFLLVAGLVGLACEVTVRGMLWNPLRTGFVEILLPMGADLRFTNQRSVGGEEVIDVTARSSRLRAVETPPGLAPAAIDEYPILAVAAAFAEGETTMHGLGELRVKESDRLSAIVTGLQACRVAARVKGDSLLVRGGAVPGGATVETRGDHRIAMAFLVLGLAAEEPVMVDGAEMIATSFPGFADTMRGLGARIEAA